MDVFGQSLDIFLKVCFTLLNVFANNFIIQLCVHVINSDEHSYFFKSNFLLSWLSFFHFVTLCV